MALPTDRASLAEWILRKLGKPVIRINVDQSQIDDRIDEALEFWTDYSYDGTEAQYYKYQVTSDDMANGYITLPENIIGAVRIFDLSVISSSISNPFNIQYQIVMNDIFNIASVSLVPYYTTFAHLQFLQQMLIGLQPIRYNRMNNRLYVDMNWTDSNLSAGMYLIVECYSVIDPDEYPNVYKDRQLLALSTALVKLQWGENLSKFAGVQLPGGVMFNGLQLKQEALKEVEEAKQAIMDSRLPPLDMIG